MKIITDTLNQIMNAKKVGKRTCVVQASNLLVNVLKIIKEHGYIDFKIEKGEKINKVVIEIKKLNECRAITPRFYAKHDEIEKYAKRFLPARNVGVIIISTSKGLTTHHDIKDKKIGGTLIAYCF